jgi:dihydroxy-acid dehydratase
MKQVEDGDMIDIDADKKTMTLEVEESVLQSRRDSWTAPPLKATSGTLYKYTKLVSSASLGCVTDL